MVAGARAAVQELTKREETALGGGAETFGLAAELLVAVGIKVTGEGRRW